MQLDVYQAQAHLKTLKYIKNNYTGSEKTMLNAMINNMKEMYQEANEIYAGMAWESRREITYISYWETLPTTIH